MGKRTDLKTFSMNPDTFQHLDEIAKRCGCSRSSVLAILINNYYEFMKCSACGGIKFFAMTPQDEGWEYCPYCGAKMDEEMENKS